MLKVLDARERDDPVATLKEFISEGGYVPGDRLPAERELIVELGVSRATLRKALDVLERDGMIWRHVGKGTFISSQGGPGSSGNLLELGRHLTPVKMIRARLCIEPAIAREAAINASRDAINRINAAKERAREALTWEAYEAEDDHMHRAIAECTDNPLLLGMFDQLNQVRRAVALGNVVRGSERPPDNHSSFTEHERISAAIEARDPSGAEAAMRQHIASVSARLFGED
ncbi:MAG: FadR family transcriptional regulator [Nisaea sp.]|uniref:FadR/GntR family transcriptional regulator n=1 Tax=Nisaea sp. TaxID=2024842 RepID=UPI001B0BA801|nr:FadR/GntR family transcriptional regulator [Nisaea sp.]MBO6562283.1 FadR family transcriptional regulator [Nisaea sp.]